MLPYILYLPTVICLPSIEKGRKEMVPSSKITGANSSVVHEYDLDLTSSDVSLVSSSSLVSATPLPAAATAAHIPLPPKPELHHNKRGKISEEQSRESLLLAMQQERAHHEFLMECERVKHEEARRDEEMAWRQECREREEQ
jgi:hypothetical protein